MQITIILLQLLQLFNLVIINGLAFNNYIPSCKSCLNFIPHEKGVFDLGQCKIFKNTYKNGEIEITIHNYAKHCRDNEFLCSPNGYLHEDIYKHKEHKKEEFFRLLDEIDELNNRCCGEVNEKQELYDNDMEYNRLIERLNEYKKKYML